MNTTLRSRIVAAFVAVTAGSASSAGLAAAPDSTLFTTYYVTPTPAIGRVAGVRIDGAVRGLLRVGALGPFGRIGSMLESHPVAKGDTVTRRIYALDIASWERCDRCCALRLQEEGRSHGKTTVTVSLEQTIELPLAGGTGATAFMAANTAFLYVGTNQSYAALRIDPTSWTYTGVGGFEPPIPVAAINTDSYGYVTVTFGSSTSAFNGFYVFGPDRRPAGRRRRRSVHAG